MIRNIDLVFRLLTLPFAVAAAQTWTLIAAIAVSYLAVSWVDVDLSRMLIYGFVAVVAAGLAGALSHLGSTGMALGVLVLAGYLLLAAEPAFERVLPKNEGYRVTANIPISLTSVMTATETIAVGLRNDSVDWMEHALVECRGTYLDGTPAERPWRKGISAGHWLPPGGTISERRIVNLMPNEAQRYDLSRTNCRIFQADFRRTPLVAPSFTFAMLPKSGLLKFSITNDTPSVLTAVRFSCAQSGDIRVTFLTRPLFHESLDYRLQPGSSMELVSERMFTEVHDCLIYSVDAL